MTEYTVAKFVDQWSADLTQELSAAGTIAYVDPAKAALLPSANNGRGYALTLDDGAGNFEIVFVTAANGTTGALTLWRNRWNTNSQIWPVGTTIELRIPAAMLNNYMLRLPVAISEVNATAFLNLNWREYTATHVMLTQNITTLGMDTLVAFNSAMAGMIIHDVLIQQDATGGRTVGWDGSLIHWPGGTAPTVTATADRMDIFRIFRVSPAMDYYVGVILGQDIPV